MTSEKSNAPHPDEGKPHNFIQLVIEKDLAEGRVKQIVTRFPPEPNGYLHIGHAKAICINFDLAHAYGGICHLRFDDTNPETESEDYVQAIIEDVHWLGFDWVGDIRYASDYFQQLYEWAQQLVLDNKAYVCELSAEETREYRGTLTEPGQNSPFRERPSAESLALLKQMREGEIPEGRMTLRAKIDMSSPNLNMRDPVLYRVKHVSHHRVGDWNIYPSYDFAHGQEDAIEGITHSICTLEFADHRPLYDWFIENLPVPSTPKQYEFGRLNLNYTVTSKRKLRQLVEEGHVQGWDDPRMPTLSGLRRRGVSASAVRQFCNSLAVAKTDGVVDMAQFDHFIRQDLNDHAPRAMCVLNPLKLTVINWPDEQVEVLHADSYPSQLESNKKGQMVRELAFSKTLYIDRNDFSEDSSQSRKKFKRLVTGDWVRLRAAYVIRAEAVVRDEQGEITEVQVSVVPNTVGQNPPEGIRPRGVIHWVSAEHSLDCTVRLYDRLFTEAQPDASGKNFLEALNPLSLQTLHHCKAEASLSAAEVGQAYQFEREGYFCLDGESHETTLIFNRTIGLRDTRST